MKKIILILFLFLSACNPYQSNSEITSRAVVEITPQEVLENKFNQLKSTSLIKENNFSTTEGLNNGASVLDNELVLENPSNQNQYLDTGISVKDLNQYSLSLWFKTNDISKVQILLWQGVNTQNGWGSGTNDINSAELNVGLNHWNNTFGNAVSVFYGYNESAVSPSLVPVSFPMKLNQTSGQFEMLGNPFLFTSNYHHLVVTVEKTGSEIKIKTYVDGAFIEEGVGSQIDNSKWNRNLFIGKAGVDSQRNFSGRVKNFLSFDKILTLEDVNVIYNIQK